MRVATARVPCAPEEDGTKLAQDEVLGRSPPYFRQVP